MSRRTASIRRTAILTALVAGLALVGLAPQAGALPATFKFAGPVFGLSARGGTLFAADSGAGIWRISSTGTKQKLIQRLPGVTDVAPLRHRRMWALTSAPRDKKLYFINKRGRIREIANLGVYEKRHNPDEGEIDSNPFDLQAIGGRRVLVADAGGNDLLVVNRKGKIDWIATLPSQDVSTQDIKDLVGCPDPPDPDNQQICNLPDTMPAEPVATGVAVGPDGAYYVTELKGFPAPTRRSRVWRIDPGIRNVHCRGSITTNGCTVAVRSLTSIVDIDFDSAGNAYVVELDEATWFAVEAVPSGMLGGTIDQCDTNVTPWECTVFSGDLTEPMAVTFTANGTPYALVKALKRHPEVIALT